MGGGGAVLAAVGAIAETGLPVRILAGGTSMREPAEAAATAQATSSRSAERRSRSPTPTPRGGSSWRTRSGTASRARRTCWTSPPSRAGSSPWRPLRRPVQERRQLVRRDRGGGEASSDHAWRLPLHERYHRYNDSAFADLKNSSDYQQASPILAAAFLETFAGEGPWAHLDIAGTAYLERGRGDYYAAGGHRVRRAAAHGARPPALRVGRGLQTCPPSTSCARRCARSPRSGSHRSRRRLDREHRFPVVGGAGRARAYGHPHPRGARRRRGARSPTRSPSRS